MHGSVHHLSNGLGNRNNGSRVALCTIMTARPSLLKVGLDEVGISATDTVGTRLDLASSPSACPTTLNKEVMKPLVELK